MVEELLKEIASHGDMGSVVPFSRIEDIKRDIISIKNGDFSTDWINRIYNHLTEKDDRYIPKSTSFKPLSIITVVMKNPKYLVQFQHKGRTSDFILPPVYINFENKNEETLKYLTKYLNAEGFLVEMIPTIPQKLLAVHTGLGKYGRNNICYNDEFGSYMQIMSFISDIPANESTMWYPLTRMEVCNSCHACVTTCPMSAIDINRSLIDSDRCITYFNENDGAFPSWFSDVKPNSLFGCIKCQDCCPLNNQFVQETETLALFTEEETTEILETKAGENYSNPIYEKLLGIGISVYYIKPEILSRNLALLLM